MRGFNCTGNMNQGKLNKKRVGKTRLVEDEVT